VFGTDAEARVIELAGIDPAHRSDYALALSACGSDRSREILAEWANDPRAEVRAAVFEALGILGLDERGARLAIEALGSAEPAVRATAASALRGWIGPGGAAAQLAARLDDTWTVAVQAARSLEAMGAAGTAALRQARPQSEQGVFLAGQIIWEANER
jgi:HEAT repeat protein